MRIGVGLVYTDRYGSRDAKARCPEHEDRRVLTPGDFKARWHNRAGSERGLAQAHFLDLRAMLGQDTGETDYVFEQPVTKAGGGQGFADVWKPGHFAVEYKQEGKDLRAAYAQLLAYKDAFGNPPLLVVSDLRRIVIYPNFHNTAATPYEIGIEEMDDPEKLRWLRWLFTDPDKLRPRITRDDVTKAAAARFGAIAARLTARGHDPARVAHLLVQLLFCLFAEDAGVLPKGLVKRTFDFGAKHPDQFDAQLRALLSAMATGGFFNMEPIPVINGGLFAVVDPLPLGQAELTELAEAATLDWSSVEPAIFGTLFERSLDPSSRAQLGAHYTGRADIERVVDPVVMVPLRRRWAEVRATAAPIVERIAAAPSPTIRRNRQAELASLLLSFREELAAVTVLDPACGSGNFLYVALELLLTLDREVIAYGTAAGLSGMTPLIRPSQLRGLEINPYARELAQVVIWIGYLQWMIGNGFGWTEPVLAALETIELRDALLDRTDPAHPKEAEWPAADYIVGNPPFLGAQRLRSELGDAYVEDLFVTYSGRVPHGADLATYFFEKAREHIALRETQRAGLLATQSIRKGASRRILDRIKESGDIFMAWSDEPWTLNGADVRISIIGFDGGRESTRVLDNASVTTINADLTSEIDVTAARQLAENLRLSYKGVEKGGPFEVPGELARRWLSLPTNPNGRPNSDVLRPLINGIDVTRRPRTSGSSTSRLARPSRRPRCTRLRSSTQDSTSGPSALRTGTPSTRRRGGCCGVQSHRCGPRCWGSPGTSPRPASPVTAPSFGLRSLPLPIAASMSSPATTTTSSACSTPAPTRCGRSRRRHGTESATTQPTTTLPASRPSPCRGRRVESQPRPTSPWWPPSPRRPRRSTCCGRGGSTRRGRRRPSSRRGR